MQGRGSRVWGSGLGVRVSGFWIQGLELRDWVRKPHRTLHILHAHFHALVQGSGFRIHKLEFRVSGLEITVEG